jgi:hypothetical protein
MATVTLFVVAGLVSSVGLSGSTKSPRPVAQQALASPR